MKKYAKYFAFIKRSWLLVILGFAFNLLFGVLKTEGAVYLQKITDAIESGEMGSLLTLVLIGGGLTYFSFVIRWLGAIVPQYLQEKFSFEIRVKLWEHLTKIPFLKYESRSAINSITHLELKISFGSSGFHFLRKLLLPKCAFTAETGNFLMLFCFQRKNI